MARKNNLKYVRAFGSKKYRNIIYIFGFIGIGLVIQQFETFLNTFMYFFSFKGLMLYLITLIFVKSLHELGTWIYCKIFWL